MTGDSDVDPDGTVTTTEEPERSTSTASDSGGSVPVTEREERRNSGTTGRDRSSETTDEENAGRRAVLAVGGTAAIVGALGFLAEYFIPSGTTTPRTPTATLEFDYAADANRVEIGMTSGTRLTVDNTGGLYYRVRGEDRSRWELPVESGDTTILEDVHPGDTVVVVWVGPEGQTRKTFGEYTVADGRR